MFQLINLKSTLNSIPQTVKTSEFPLAKIKLQDFEGIQEKIPLFDDGKKFVNIFDIAFITKYLETLDLFRGCSVGCTHCLKNAVPLSKKIRSILFEDLMRFTDGFKTLSERFGFNVLQGNNYISVIDDSNPTDFPIKGLTQNHDIAEAVKLIYEKLRIPIVFVTSGWNAKSAEAQNSAKNLAKEFKTNPQSLKSLEISINPFSGIMETSRKALVSGDMEKAAFYRELYTNRMANTLLTFFDLFKGEETKARLIYRHANNFDGNELVGENETKKLYIEIYDKLKIFLGEKIKEAPTLIPDIVTKFDRSHLIEPSGRGRRYFPFEYNMRVQAELISEADKWDSMSAEEQRKFLQDHSVKCVNIKGNIYTTFPAISVKHEYSPVEITVPTDIQLNYLEQNKLPPVFSDIELD